MIPSFKNLLSGYHFTAEPKVKHGPCVSLGDLKDFLMWLQTTVGRERENLLSQRIT